MTKINGTEFIEMDTAAGDIGAAHSGRRLGRGLPAFADLRLACINALDRMGLPRTANGDFRMQTRREHIAHRRSVHRAVVKISRGHLSRAKRNSSLVTGH